jgi:small GTP-binding protein
MPLSQSFYPHKLRNYHFELARKAHNLSGDDLIAAIKEIINDIKEHQYDKAKIFQEYVKSLEEMVQETQNKKKGKMREYDPFEIKRSGDARVVLFGMTNVGKSTLMNSITNAKVRTGNYKHTTTTALGGTCIYDGVQIQMVDLPGFIDFTDDWRTNKQIIRVARTSDAILMVIDLSLNVVDQYNFLYSQLQKAKIIMDGEAVFQIQIIATKGDLPGSKENYETLKSISAFKTLPISINNEKSLQELQKGIYDILEIMKVYTKKHTQKADFDNPMVVRTGTTVYDIAKKIHKDFVEQFSFAKVWGKSVEFDEQSVGSDHELKDGDVVEIFLK